MSGSTASIRIVSWNVGILNTQFYKGGGRVDIMHGHISTIFREACPDVFLMQDSRTIFRVPLL